MSTSFEVYPTSENLPTYAELLKRTNELFEMKLRSLGVDKRFDLDFTLKNKEGTLYFNKNEVLDLTEHCYLWVFTPEVEGGFCIDQLNNDQVQADLLWEAELEREQSKRLEPLIRTSLKKKDHWSVTRYAGTASLYHLAYGIMAGALAELTKGIVFTDDDAWEYSKFPCLLEEFFAFYFDPNRAIDQAYKEAAVYHIENILKDYGGNSKNELQGGPFFELSFVIEETEHLQHLLDRMIRSSKMQIVTPDIPQMIADFYKGYPFDEEDAASHRIHQMRLNVTVKMNRVRQALLFAERIHTNLLCLSLCFYGSEFDTDEWDQPGIGADEKPEFYEMLRNMYQAIPFLIGGSALEEDIKVLFGTNECWPHAAYAIENLAADRIADRMESFDQLIISNDLYKKLELDVKGHVLHKRPDGVEILLDTEQ
ncbi:hypothetical protein CDO73_01520 [Saccharibacillus sp. O23]|uniref:hypothetical protein n=1 Tax=Saccharibacillus sp. O23 TaxID=2009338 RepID=UPI000B4E3D30|nr:hypothetical protein [Saccharibacillus sp. O23]OWR32314.1 hypothetical protein CDO73_01520 [Saccharibacillus sp. O23]